MMNVEELERLGRFIHGERWKSPLARDLGVSNVTIHAWVNGGKMPVYAAIAVRALAEAKRTPAFAKALRAQRAETRV
jgi:hypothetical protein